MTKKMLTIIVWLAFLSLVFVYSVPAQTEKELKSLKDEIEALKDSQRSMKSDLDEIKSLLLRGAQAAPKDAPPADFVMNIADDPYKGDRNARLTMVEFSDYQCPFCARFFSQTLSQIERDYVNTGKVKYVFRDFPIERIHKQALKAAEAANCAGEQGKYWEMHDKLFANQKALGLEDLSNYSRQLVLDAAKFQECLNSGKYAEEIRKDLEEGAKAGVQGTPTFFLGFTDPDKAILKPVRAIRGAQPFENFKNVIEGLLSEQKK